MDYEKKYKEAVNKIKNLLDDGEKNGFTIVTYKTDLESIFPELKESENELTWLTKYIEEEAYSLSMDIRDNEDRIKLKNLQKALAWLEKQGKQKPAWSEEDEKMIRGLIVICDEWTTRHSFYPIENCEIEKLKNWLESLKERYTWKPSDEQMAALKFVIESLDNMFTAIGYMDNYTKPLLEEILEALKKLREE